MDVELVQHLMDLKEGQGKIVASLETIEKLVLGDGQPGLLQKVEDLEAAKNRLWGAGAVITGLAGVAEWLLHIGKHSAK